MANPEGESISKPLRLDFDRRLKLEFHGSRVTSDEAAFGYCGNIWCERSKRFGRLADVMAQRIDQQEQQILIHCADVRVWTTKFPGIGRASRF